MKKDDEKEIKTALHRIMSFGGRRKRVENSLWKAKWLPVIVMLVRWYGTFDFYSNLGRYSWTTVIMSFA